MHFELSASVKGIRVGTHLFICQRPSGVGPASAVLSDLSKSCVRVDSLCQNPTSTCAQGSVTKNMMFPAASDMKLPGLLSFDSEDVANLLLALARDPGAQLCVLAGTSRG